MHRRLAFPIAAALALGLPAAYAQDPKPAEQSQPQMGRGMMGGMMQGDGMMAQMSRMMENCNKMMESHMQREQRQPPQGR
jgi:hypothetical protein